MAAPGVSFHSYGSDMFTPRSDVDGEAGRSRVLERLRVAKVRGPLL